MFNCVHSTVYIQRFLYVISIILKNIIMYKYYSHNNTIINMHVCRVQLLMVTTSVKKPPKVYRDKTFM